VYTFIHSCGFVAFAVLPSGSVHGYGSFKIYFVRNLIKFFDLIYGLSDKNKFVQHMTSAGTTTTSHLYCLVLAQMKRTDG
jgi:hypothetical protein